MAETTPEAKARRRRLTWINGIAIVVLGCGYAWFRIVRDDHGPGLALAFVVGVLVVMVVFLGLVRRNLSPEHKHAVRTGEVLPGANREELRVDLERSRRSLRRTWFNRRQRRNVDRALAELGEPTP